MTAWFTFDQPKPRVLVKKFGPRWCVLREVAPKRFVHVSDHAIHAEALDAAGWFAWWLAHDGQQLDQLGSHIVYRHLQVAWWVAQHWGER